VRQFILILSLAALLPVLPPLAAKQPINFETQFLPPDELRRALRESYIPDPTPEPTPEIEKNLSVGLEDRLQVNALYSAAEALRSQGKSLESIVFYEQAAKKGNTMSLLRLAELHSGYDEGLIPDAAKVESYYRAAAARNNRTALVRLAEIHRDGRGVKKDSDKAAKYYRQAISLSWKLGSQDEVVAATAALILDNQIDYGNFEDILKIVEVLKMICAESAGQPADRAVVLLQALNLVEKEKGRRELKPAQMAEESKKTTTKSKLISFIENLLADPYQSRLTIDSALAELDQAASDPSIASLPRLQHRAALLIALAQAPAEVAKSRADGLFNAAAYAGYPPALFRVRRPTAESIKKNLESPSSSESDDSDTIAMIEAAAKVGDLGMAAQVRKQPRIAMIEAAAKVGDPAAQFELGQLWLQGIGRERNDWRAFQAFEKSAEGGHLDGIHMLARCYARGIGTSIDRRQAAHLFSLAADKDHAEGMYGFAMALANGRGIEANPVVATEWLKKAADAGSPAAHIALAKEALSPKPDGSCDIVSAKRHYLEAARAGDNGSRLEFLKLVFASASPGSSARLQTSGATGEEILKWSQSLATDKTLPEKQRRLASYFEARCHAEGLGTEQDLIQASRRFVNLSGTQLPKPTPEPSEPLALPLKEVITP
jgi:TPR repeat protein